MKHGPWSSTPSSIFASGATHASDRRRSREGRRLVAAVHDVAMDLHVFRRRADVDPVAVVHVGDERLAALDERRKEAALDRPGGVLGNPVERVRLEHVDAGVDRVAGDLVVARLLQEPPDAAVGLGLDEPVGAGILDRHQHDRRLGLARAVQPEHGPEIHVGEHVAVEHHDRIGQRVSRVPDRAPRAERDRLDDVADAHAEALAVAEDLFDAARLVIEAEDHLVDLGHLPEQVDLVIEKRPVQDRHDGFRRVDGQRPQPGALATGEQDSLHVNLR